MRTSIILPTLQRPQQLVNSLADLQRNTTGMEIEVIVVVDDNDFSTLSLKNQISMSGLEWKIIKSPMTAVEKWNIGAKISVGDWLLLASDDYEYAPNWLQAALSVPNHGFVAIPDQFPGKTFEPFYLVSRDWLRKHQGRVLAVPHYAHWGIDMEICERAKAAGHYVVSPVGFHHKHWLFKEADKDFAYTKAENHHHADMELLAVRRAKGFPNDFVGYL